MRVLLSYESITGAVAAEIFIVLLVVCRKVVGKIKNQQLLFRAHKTTGSRVLKVGFQVGT